MGWLRKLPIVSLLIAGAMGIVPSGLLGELDSSASRFETAREEARLYFERNPRLVVDPVGEIVLGREWLASEGALREKAVRPAAVELPRRMLARSQTRLDQLIETAYQERLASEPAWRFGVLDARTPEKNYFVHAFVHEAAAGVLLIVAVLLLVGAPLERAWGSLVFGLFALSAIPITAYADRLLAGSSGVPWSGSAGLAGALIGAYFIRGLGGHFRLPGWLLLPAWLGLEAIVVRGFSFDSFGGVPWASFMAAIAFGALVAGTLRLLGVESKLDTAAQGRREQAPHPVVVRAARLRSDGDPSQAFELIGAAWREDPTNAEVAESFFSIAVEVGQPEAAAEAIVPSLHAALKSGDVARALEYWLPLARCECDVRLEATAAVRLGEALLDGGHPEEAIFSLRGALDAGVSTAHATRIVSIARDLDEALARRAAHLALSDPTLEPRIRADLEPIATPSARGPDAASGASDAGTDGPGADEMVDVPDRDGPAGDPEAVAGDPNEAALIEQALDPSALSAETLGGDSEPEVAAEADGASGDVLSHWNDPSLLEAPGVDLSADLSETPLLSAEDLDALGDELDLDATGDGLQLDPREAETDSDMTPLLGASDELVATGAGAADTAPVFDQPTTVVAAPPALSSDSTEEMAPAGEGDPSMRTDAAAAASDAMQPARSLKALDAVPSAEGDDWIEVDVDERGKSRLPVARIQAISMGAVAGLGPRPVLVVDFALNWDEDPAEPLKLIRLRSDRFDPHRFEPSAKSPLEALTAWMSRLQAAADARCLPSREVLEGRFGRFDSLAAYERAVLGASAPD
ncbi:MAG: rhomboid family intramembrane serine protease [Deltaproteobacteria bacterium]|nr:rhomboid family intramembrane serine protease [Deltaproteobacteria bacterium]